VDVIGNLLTNDQTDFGQVAGSQCGADGRFPCVGVVAQCLANKRRQGKQGRCGSGDGFGALAGGFFDLAAGRATAVGVVAVHGSAPQCIEGGGSCAGVLAGVEQTGSQEVVVL